MERHLSSGLASVEAPGPYEPDSDLQLRPEEALSRCLEGRIIVVRRALQQLGFFDPITRLTLEIAEKIAGSEKARRLEEEGFERLHAILAPKEIHDLHVALHDVLQAQWVTTIVRRFYDDILRGSAPLYVCRSIMVRMFVPHDVFEANRKAFSERLGTLRIHGPHFDAWFTHPYNGVNMWMALGRVRRGNSVMLWPELWRQYDRVPHEGIHISREAVLGRPVAYDLDPGDLLLFHCQHLHSSELNTTAETRFVLTTRFAVGAPRYGEGSRWIPYYDTRLLDTPAAFAAAWRSRMSRAFLRARTGRLGRLLG